MVDENQGAVSSPSGKVIVAIQSTVTGGTFTVKGSGIYQYLAANSSSPAATNHIDPSTGSVFAANDNSAGYYEGCVYFGDVRRLPKAKPSTVDSPKWTASDSDKAVLYLARA